MMEDIAQKCVKFYKKFIGNATDTSRIEKYFCNFTLKIDFYYNVVAILYYSGIRN